MDWPAVLSVDKITKRAALIQNLPLAKAPRCSLALTRAFTPTLERGHAVGTSDKLQQILRSVCLRSDS